MNRLANYTLFILCALSVAACTGASSWSSISFSKASEGVKLRTADLKEVPEDSYLTEDEMGFDVQGDLDFMQPEVPEDSAACAAMNRYIIGHLLQQPETATQKEAIEGYITRMKRDFKAQDFMMACYDHLTGTAELGPRGIINYTLHEDFYGGGAHPTQNYTVVRFRSDDGSPIGLWEVFNDSCEHTLEQLLTRRLMEQHEVKTLEELQQLGYLDMVDMFVPQNFWMQPDSIVFFFNQYDIAPYALGCTSLPFSYEELKPYMR